METSSDVSNGLYKWTERKVHCRVTNIDSRKQMRGNCREPLSPIYVVNVIINTPPEVSVSTDKTMYE